MRARTGSWIAKLGRVVLAALLYAAPLVAGAPDAQARVSPLTVITRQIKKPNMLIVLDTSGSMNGVPGAPFTFGSEVGVDCDNGVDCRAWSKVGTNVCSVTGETCTQNTDCQKPHCRVGNTGCASDADCPQQGYCKYGSHYCSKDADCVPYAEGLCTGSGKPCSATTPCAPHGSCADTGDGCDEPGKACKTGWCQHSHKTKQCFTDRDCPANSGGSCTFGSTPKGGCFTDGDCAETRKCTTGESCASAADCPRISSGTCKVSKLACSSDADCRQAQTGENDSYVDSCLIPTNACVGQPNLCLADYDNCSFSAGNTCQSIVNNCHPVTNTCVVPTPNSCLVPNASNVCQNGQTASGALRMCRDSQGLCTTDADCPPGDPCGPPSSRTVIAKRTLSRVIQENYSLANLGLMTFYQSGYFPYYPLTTPTPTTDSVFLSRLTMGKSCYGKQTGPTATCSYQGRTWSLKSGSSSRYLINDKNRARTVDAAWCGDVCSIPGVGTGRFDGSYYFITGTTGATAAAPTVQPSYVGKSYTSGGQSYRYYDTRPDYYNGGAAPPIGIADCSAGLCSAQCGARWDASLSPFINPTATDAESQASAFKILDWMNKGSYGGLVTFGGTPSGCALQNKGAATEASGAYAYMSKLKASDPYASCRPNYVLFVTDGEANGPGDVACGDAACSAPDPAAAGCSCLAVTAAYKLRKDLGVRTFVIGFSPDAATGLARTINDNVARAGGTDQNNDGLAPFAYLATNETQLHQVLQSAIYDAVKGSYSTSPATASAGSQLSGTIRGGHYALDARVDFPSWEGHLLAYDVTQEPPALAWDANTELRKMSWYDRRLYFGTTDGQSIKVELDPNTHAVVNRATLYGLGIGSDEVEAERIVRYTMGDPALGNPIRLGALINSTPIDVGMPGDDTTQPGGHEFFLTYQKRPNLTYVGSDDGMLHAFFSDATNVGGATYSPGAEAFAYVPPSMISTIEKLYAQRGQVADPTQHVFGLANSAKVKNLCISGCSDASTAVWKTLLIMNSGYGGPGVFVLDVTNPLGADGFAEPPVLPIWDSTSATLRTSYAASMGLSMSVPGFFRQPNATTDAERVIFASGYRDGGPVSQGRQVIIASAGTGQITDRAAGGGIVDGACTQEYTILADVATAKDFQTDTIKTLRAAFVGDTFGNLWRYDGNAPSKLSLVKSYGCKHPLHFAPTVVQLDRDDNRFHKNEAYLAQVTNSTLDEDTISFDPSQLTIFKLRVDDKTSQLVPSPEFGTSGMAAFSTGNDICAETTAGGACAKKLPTTARPTGTPLAILKRDASGFDLVATWYAPDAAGCGKGSTWLTLHEIVGDQVDQKQGMFLGNEPINGPVVVNGRIYVVGSTGPVNLTGDIGATFSPGVASPHPGVEGMFQLLGWMERD